MNDRLSSRGYERDGPIQRLVEFGRIVSARLRQVGPAASRTADDRRNLLDNITRLDIRSQIRRYRNQQRSLVVAKVGPEGDDRRAVLLPQAVCQIPQRPRVQTLDLACHDFDAVDLADIFGSRPRGRTFAGGELLFERAKLLFELLLARDQSLQTFERLRVARAKMTADVGENLFTLADCFQRALTGKCFDAAHTCGDARLRLKFEKPDIAGAADVGAAA